MIEIPINAIKSKLSNYKKICKTKFLEARIYPPTKRTINTCGRNYFVQFPEMFAAKVNFVIQPDDYFNVFDYTFSNYPVSFLNFALVKNDRIFKAPLGQVDYVVNKWGVCLTSFEDNGEFNHIWFKPKDKLEKMMYWFWNTSFGVIEGEHLFTSYHEWTRMNLNQVLKKMNKPIRTINEQVDELTKLSKEVLARKSRNLYDIPPRNDAEVFYK